MEWEMFPDRDTPDTWRVEATSTDGEGLCYVTIFAGPDSERRAREYGEWMNEQRRSAA